MYSVFGEYAERSAKLPNVRAKMNVLYMLVFGRPFGDFGMPNISFGPKVKKAVSLHHYQAVEKAQARHCCTAYVCLSWLANYLYNIQIMAQLVPFSTACKCLKPQNEFKLCLAMFNAI